jgi:hypothetical protein
MQGLGSIRRMVKVGATLGAFALTLAACGSDSTSGSDAVVMGVVASEASRYGAVSVKGASAPAQERTTTVDDSGSFALEVEGLNPPFLLEAEAADGEETARLYSISREGGWANVNPITAAAVAGAADDDAGDAYGWAQGDVERVRGTADRFDRLVAELQTVLQPLFERYGVPSDAVTEGRKSDELRAMLRDVRIKVVDRTIFVTNRETGGVIFSGPLRDLDAGTFNPVNLPDGPGTTPTPPEACTYAYSQWSACQSDGAQTRTVTSSSPEGCSGTPVVSQACTLVPPVEACTAFTYSGWSACQSDATQTRTVTSSSPAGCTGGSPVVTQACTLVPPVNACAAFTYSGWSACQSDGTQTRIVTSSSPTGCTGGSPVVTQACTWVPPVCTYTYSSWSTCSSSGTQTRTVASSSPASCAGTPVLSQTCTPPPPPTTSCTTCHAIPPATGKHARHASITSCNTCHGTGYSPTTVNSATHQNGVKNVVTASPVGWDASTRTCAAACHGTKSW